MPKQSIYDEVELEDLAYDAERDLFHYPCPCGDRFEITRKQLRDAEDIATCPSCSLVIRVVFDPVSRRDGTWIWGCAALVKGRQQGRSGHWRTAVGAPLPKRPLTAGARASRLEGVRAVLDRFELASHSFFDSPCRPIFPGCFFVADLLCRPQLDFEDDDDDAATAAPTVASAGQTASVGA
jgi:diphthamide biosynthesis protein 3